MARKILLYSALLFPTMSFIVLLAETPYKHPDYCSIGPNSAICFLSGVYLCLFEMIIYTLKAKNRKQIILYMAEPYELAAEIKSPDRKSIIKAILAIVILAVISWIYVFSYYGFGLSRFFVMGAICDIPSLLCIVIYVLPLIAISGCLGDLLGAVKTTMALNCYGAITSTVIGWIRMMNNLEDASSLFPNISVSLVTLFYAILLNLLLLIGAFYKVVFVLMKNIFIKTNPQIQKDNHEKSEYKNDFSKLSRREIEVAKLAAKGYTNAQIAETLFISIETVKRHMASIFEKLEITSRKELMNRCHGE